MFTRSSLPPVCFFVVSFPGPCFLPSFFPVLCSLVSFPLCLSPLLSFLLSPLGRHVLLLCSLARIKLDIFIPDYMVLMERSRSPNRSPPLQAGLRPLVNFPVWTHPMENRAQTPTSVTWSQEPQGSSTLPEVPLSQQSMMIPPGQPGASQQSLDLSQPSVAHVVSPRPQVQGLGIGMAGMMQTFPPPSIVGDSKVKYCLDLPTVVRAHLLLQELFYHQHLGASLPKHLREAAKLLPEESQTSRWDNIGKQMRSFMVIKKSMDYLFLELFDLRVGVNSKTLKAVILLQYH